MQRRNQQSGSPWSLLLFGITTQSPDVRDVNLLTIDSDQALLVQTGHGPRDDFANGPDSSGQLLFRDAQLEFNGVSLLAACLCLIEKPNGERCPTARSESVSTSAAHFRKRRDKTRNAAMAISGCEWHMSSTV